MNNSKKLLIPFIATLVGALLIVLTLFLPYASAADETRQGLEMMSSMPVSKDSGITAGDMIDISMVEFASLYIDIGDAGSGDEESVPIYVGMIALIGVFGLLAAVFALFKKPIAVIIFDILALAVFLLQNWDYTEREVIGEAYNWGAAYYVFFVAAIITFVAAIWLLVTKKQIKKAAQVVA